MAPSAAAPSKGGARRHDHEQARALMQRARTTCSWMPVSLPQMLLHVCMAVLVASRTAGTHTILLIVVACAAWGALLCTNPHGCHGSDQCISSCYTASTSCYTLSQCLNTSLSPLNPKLVCQPADRPLPVTRIGVVPLSCLPAL